MLDLLRDRIAAGEFPVDRPLRLDALAADLAVGRSKLRELFAKLEQEGLVEIRSGREVFISTTTAAEACDVFDLRLKIEPDVVALAATLAQRADHELARRALLDFNAAAEAGQGGLGVLNRAFHMALIRPTGRATTMQIVERLQVTSERYVVKHLEASGRNARAASEHFALYEAWEAGEARKASGLSAWHIEMTLRDLRHQL